MYNVNTFHSFRKMKELKTHYDGIHQHFFINDYKALSDLSLMNHNQFCLYHNETVLFKIRVGNTEMCCGVAQLYIEEINKKTDFSKCNKEIIKSYITQILSTIHYSNNKGFISLYTPKNKKDPVYLNKTFTNILKEIGFSIETNTKKWTQYIYLCDPKTHKTKLNMDIFIK